MMGFSLPGSTPEILDLLIRVTVLLCGVTLLGLAFRRRTASVRHTLWTAAFVTLLVLPVVAVAGISWEVPLLPQVESAQYPTSTPTPTTADEVHDTPAAPSVTAVGAQAFNEPPAEPLAFQPSQLLWLVWSLGCVGSVLSLLVGFARMRSIVRTAEAPNDEDWSSRLAEAKRRVGLQRDVRLLVSRSVSTPLTTGLIRPLILLPKASDTWSAARRDVVLQHELVHVRRHDAVRQVLGQLALSLYWFHPMSWLASRLAVAVREEACDEAVLAMGTRPSDYARHLFDIARSADGRAVAALPMVQPSQLERRIMAILDSSRPRDTVLLTCVAFAAVVVLGVVTATLQPTPLSSQIAAPPAVAAVAPVPPVAPLAPMLPELRVGSPVTAPLPSAPQEMTCRVEGVRGSFSGTFSTRTNRTEMLGRHNGDRIVQKHDDDLRMCMRVHGDVVMNDDDRTVRAMGSDSWIVIETEQDRLHRLVITEGSDGIEYAWSIDGRERPYDGDAQEWTEDILTILRGYQEASRIRGQQSSLRGKISSYRGEVSSMRGQISSHRGQVSTLRGQISSYRGRASSVRGQISTLRGNVSSLKGLVSSHHGQISSLRSASRATADPETRAALEREVAEHEKAIRDLEQEIEEFGLDAQVEAKRQDLEALEVQRYVEEMERRISEYDLDGRVREIEQRIEEFDLDGKVREIEREIEALDADRRAEEIERRLEPALDDLRRLIRGLR